MEITKMKKVLNFVLYIFYNYYKDGRNKDIAFMSSKTSLLVLVFFNVITILGIFNFGMHVIIPFNNSDSTAMLYLKSVCFFVLPGYFLISLFFKEKDIKELNYNENTVENGKWILVIYFIISFLAAMFFGKA